MGMVSPVDPTMGRLGLGAVIDDFKRIYPQSRG